MLKVELHAHTSDDPVDRVPHSTIDLVDRAAALGGELLASLPLHRPAWTPSPDDAPVVSGFSRTKANFSA